MKEITVLGNFSGRNAGDNAILGCLLEDILSLYPNVRFKIPTINPGFVKKSYGRHPIKAVSLLPWRLSLKIFGVPTFWEALHSDLVLITDAILFDRKLFNPLFNYLSTLALLAPWLKKCGIPLVLYNASFLPVTTEMGRKCLQLVIDNSDLVILRDLESVRMLKRLKIHHDNIQLAADCALNTRPCSQARLEEIKKKENLFLDDIPTIGFNVNTYIDIYVKEHSRGIRREQILQIISQTVDRVIDELDVNVLFVITQHMDLGVARRVITMVKNKDKVNLISNKNYSYKELAAVLSQLELFVGMRTHSMILSSSVGTPIVGIITYPKSKGFLQSIGLDHYMIEFKDFSHQQLYNLIVSAWEDRKNIRERLWPIIEREKKKARMSAKALAQFLGE